MRKSTKFFAAVAATLVAAVNIGGYASAETPVNSASWATAYTNVPHGPSNTGSSETYYLYCGTGGNKVTVTYFKNTYSNADSYATVKVTETNLTETSAKLTKNGQEEILEPWDYHALPPKSAHYKFSSYTSTANNQISVKGSIVKYNK